MTGNVCDAEMYQYLHRIAPDIQGVRGDWDEVSRELTEPLQAAADNPGGSRIHQNPELPASKILQHGPLRIGIIHGHQAVPLGSKEALASVARSLDVDVLISGGTHKYES